MDDGSTVDSCHIATVLPSAIKYFFTRLPLYFTVASSWWPPIRAKHTAYFSTSV